jgi:hypothetical protein
MPIKMKDDPEGGYRPVIICDVCDKEITQAEDGTAAWVSEVEMPTYFDFVTIHNGECFQIFDGAPGRMVSDIPLPAFVIYFERGLNLDRPKAEAQAVALSLT